MGALLDKLLSVLYARKIEIALVGVENSGKSTLLSVLADGKPAETCPTIGLNVRLVQRGGVDIKCWDLGGQEQYRGEWGRYCTGCDVILFVVDASASEEVVQASKHELHRLLEHRELATTPILVAANKIDLDPHLSEADIVKELNLDYIHDNPWIVVPISALRNQNVDKVLSWLVTQSQ